MPFRGAISCKTAFSFLDSLYDDDSHDDDWDDDHNGCNDYDDSDDGFIILGVVMIM